MYNEIRIELGALATAMFYSAQEERKNAFNRIRQIIYRKKAGKTLTEKSAKKADKDKSRGDMNDKKLMKEIESVKLSKEDKAYVMQLFDLLKDMQQKEAHYKGLITKYIEDEPIYQKFLKNIKGIATLNTANLLQYFGYCEKAKHCSSLWKFAGYDVQGGEAPRKRAGQGQITYSPKLRMLIYRISDCFVKCRTIPYRNIYDDEKKRQVSMMESAIKKMDKKQKAEFNKISDRNKKREFMNRFDPSAPTALIHAELRARRKMMKRFLQDYWMACCMIRGIKPEPPYSARFHPNE